ncbi:MAG: hypothetical protein IT289_09810 [Oligoflexia bacterium]|nr:hypothetical protein [Oligoflexia bacterium]
MRRLNENGQLTIDFLFSFILVMTVSVLLSALAYGLTLVEIVQYISFSGARVYFAAELTPNEQTQAAKAKVDQLLESTPFISRARRAGWIEIASNGHGAGKLSNYRDQIGASSDRDSFIGYQIVFNLPIMGLELPFFGAALQPPQGSPGFQTRVSSFLLREPTFQECQAVMRGAYSALIQKDPSIYGRGAGTPVLILDNGC